MARIKINLRRPKEKDRSQNPTLMIYNPNIAVEVISAIIANKVKNKRRRPKQEPAAQKARDS